MSRGIGVILMGLFLVLSSCKKESTADKVTIIESNEEDSWPGDKNSTPRITEETTIKFDEGNYDFKEIKKGEKATHVFSFTNAGKRPLILSEVRPSCGCTTPNYTKDPVLPGRKGSITVTFDSSNFEEGLISKTVAVSGNFKTEVIKFQAKIN